MSLQYGNVRWLAYELLFGLGGRHPKPCNKEEICDANEDYVKATAHTDMWSFGMTILEILTNESPFYKYANDYTVVMQIHGRILPTEPAAADRYGNVGPPSELWEGIQKCWHEIPEKRPSAAEMVILLTEASRGLKPMIMEQPSS